VTLPAEALVAVTGIFPDAPLGPQDGAAARQLPGDWRAEVKTFFGQERPRKFRLYPRPAHEATLERLTRGADLAMLTSRLADPELVTEYGAVLNNAREYVRARWPALKLDTFAGPKLLEPGFTQMAGAWAVLAVVSHPARLLTEILSATVLTEQVEAVKEVYPALFEMLRALIDERRKLELARKASWSCPWGKERVLRIILGLPADVSIAQAPQPPARAAGARINIDFASAQTRAQRIEAK
jgi:hypothetical protein